MVDSTALADELDAESFRALMEHYFQAADKVVARHAVRREVHRGRRDGRLRYPEAPRGRRPARRDRCRALRVEAAVPSSKSFSNLAAKLSLPEVTPSGRTPCCTSSAA
jgi:hypothetical protein